MSVCVCIYIYIYIYVWCVCVCNIYIYISIYSVCVFVLNDKNINIIIFTNRTIFTPIVIYIIYLYAYKSVFLVRIHGVTAC